MKKILSLILAGLMTVSCAAFVAADDAAVEATTDPVQDYAIEFLSNCGVFKGGEGLTNEDLIQRYQMALFVSRISTGWVEDSVWEDGTANDATFKDIDTEPANKYLGALSYANQNGIIEGYTANTFAPYASITYRDALTMVVRTLGYKGLSYPWGNIEKAVELGLTEGIDAAYTDELTRGEVAVIIYNAMFAKNSKGETLAKSIFGYDFGFQNIVIVSTDEYGYAANGDRAAAGYVGFKTIDENGVLGSKVYYVKASEFGFEGHAEELAVGEVFVALFEIDGDYTNMIDVASMKTATVMNNGITDNEGKAYETMPIAAALADYTLVKDYTNGILNYTYDDLRVYAYGDVQVYDLDGNVAYIGIDTSNNIVKYDGEKWVIAWYYNAVLDRYYDYIATTGAAEDATADSVADGVAINWMSDAEFTEWYNGAIKKLLATYSELTLQAAPATAITSGKYPYAKINLFNIDEDAQAEIATYKTYSIGIFSTDTANHKCTLNQNGVNHSAGVVMPRYEITTLDGNVEKVGVFVEEGHVAHDVNAEQGFGWLTVDASVTTFDPAKGGVVLYNYNKTTGEIEIVKHITAGTNDDADSKIITGVLQAYSTKNKTVTIDGVVYPISYANLDGDTLYIADNSTANRKLIAAGLDEQYMQYITATICDGYVVDVDLRGEDADSIVVLGYAGITSDGYIAVYGYKTDSLKLEVIKVNSYNGWKKGDYRYYPENAEVDDAFTFGALYTIKSYDAETNSYGVYTENVDTVLDGATPVRVTFKDGFRSVQPMVLSRESDGDFVWEVNEDKAPTIVAMSSADKYVIVSNNPEFMASSNIYVYDGVVDSNNVMYDIDAMLVGGLDSKTLVLYTLDNFIGVPHFEGRAFLDNAYDVGYVVYEKSNGLVLDAAYDEAIGGTYLLGSTLSEVTVFNLLTGTRDTVIASSNIDLVNGHIYKTIGGQILWDVTDDCAAGHNFLGMLVGAYTSRDLDYADYIIEPAVTLRKEDLTKLNLVNELGLTDNILDADDPTDVAIANQLIHNDFAKKIYVVTDEWTWDWYEHFSNIELTALEALADNTTYTADLVYEVATGKVVIYIFDDEAGNNIREDVEPVEFDGTLYYGDYETESYEPAWTLTLADGSKRYFDIEVKYTAEAVYEDEDCLGELESLKLTSLELTLVEATEGDSAWTWAPVDTCVDVIHDALADQGMCFGNAMPFMGNDDDVVFQYNTGAPVVIDEEFVTVDRADCGLAYKVVVDLADADVDFIVDSNDQIEDTQNDFVITAGNIRARLMLTPHYIDNEFTDNDADEYTFDGFSAEEVAMRRVNTGDDVFDLNQKPVVVDKITVLG